MIVMTCTVRGYPSLQNYKDEVEKNPDALRPDSGQSHLKVVDFW